MAKDRVEKMLRKGMQSVGKVVEKAIGKAQKARQSVSTAATKVAGQPDTLEGQLSVGKVKELLRLSVEQLVPSLLPVLTDRKTLEIGDGVGKFAPRMKEHGAQLVVATEIGASTVVKLTDAVSHLYLVRAAIRRLPYEDNAFDFCVANLLTPYQGSLLNAFKEIARVLAPAGTLVVADFHPFGSYARRGTARVKPTDSTFRGVADYYKAARLAGLRVTDVREAFVDETVRSAFVTPEEKQAYRALRDSPLVLCMIAKKGATE